MMSPLTPLAQPNECRRALSLTTIHTAQPRLRCAPPWQAARGMYFISAGAVQVLVRKSDPSNATLEQSDIALLGPKAFFGEMALLSPDGLSGTIHRPSSNRGPARAVALSAVARALCRDRVHVHRQT